MRKTIVIPAIVLLAPILLQAQEIVYVSDLGQTTTSSNLTGSDSWLAASFETGTNAGGYSLDSIQLAMANASGNPSGFTFMLYSANGSISPGHEITPGTSLTTLNGSANPSTAGIYTYTPASSFDLSSSTPYFIVLTAGTTVANGAYEWSNTGVFPISYNENGGWRAMIGGAIVDNYQSSNGSSWKPLGAAPEYAIAATPIPEPSPLLLLLGSGVLFYARKELYWKL